MSYWNTLELAPTSDARAIKRAYAKKLKVTQPDEHPVAFQHLYSAYQSALNYARYQTANTAHSEDTAILATPEPVETPAPLSSPLEHPAAYLTPVIRILDDVGANAANNVDQTSDNTQGNPQHNIQNNLQKTLQKNIDNESTNSAKVKLSELTPKNHETEQNSKEKNTDTPLTTQTNATNQEKTSDQARLTITDVTPDEVLEIDVPDDDEELTLDEINPYQQEGERLVAQTRELLKTRNEFHLEDRWHFLAQSAFILDDAFNWRLGLAVLQLLIDHHAIYHQVKTQQLSGHLLGYLDSLFNWNANRTRLHQHFDPLACDALLNKIVDVNSQHNTTAGLRGAKSVKLVFENRQPIATYFFPSSAKRAIACLIDLLLVWLMSATLDKGIGALLNIIFDLQWDMLMATLFAVLLTLMNWLGESSIYQTTPGKRALGLIVTNKDFQRLPRLQSFWRALIFTLSCFGFYLTLLINALMGDKMLHDRMSKSYVFDMRKTREEHNRK